MARGAADIRQVAALAGVSVGTVSNVLNRPDMVGATTRRAVLRAIDELGYVRNGSAARLRSARSDIVGLVVLDAANPFFTEVARGAEEELVRRGLSAVVCNSAGSIERQDRHLRFLDEQRVAGVLITPVDPHNAAPGLARLRERGLSVVLVDEDDADRASCSVAVDDARGGELAGAHLLGLGRRRLVFVGGPGSVRQSEDRLAGLRRAAAGHPGVVVEVVRVAALDGRSAHAVIDRVLAHEPDAVFCANDTMALGILRGLFERGRSVPDDVALVGFDDIEFAQLAAVPLTSVRQPAEQIGRAGAELLLDECSDPDEHSHRHVDFTPELVVRRSTVGR
ncbi:MAG: LacI family DNA-binding transcriptional regulator [Actinomycetota bacterium]|nr:LacI family DNA-binding transcriptional regulator [Actinomycetota bacterium]